MYNCIFSLSLSNLFVIIIKKFGECACIPVVVVLLSFIKKENENHFLLWLHDEKKNFSFSSFKP